MLAAITERLNYFFRSSENRPKKRALERDYSDDGDSDIENNFNILEPALKRSRFHLYNGDVKEEDRPLQPRSSVYNSILEQPTIQKDRSSWYSSLADRLSMIRKNAAEKFTEKCDYTFNSDMNKDNKSEKVRNLEFLTPSAHKRQDEPQYLSSFDSSCVNRYSDSDDIQYLGTSPSDPLRYLKRSVSAASTSSPRLTDPSPVFARSSEFLSPPSRLTNGIDSNFRFNPSITSTALRTNYPSPKRNFSTYSGLKSPITKEFPIIKNKNMFTRKPTSQLSSRARKYDSNVLSILRKNSANSRESFRLEEKLNYKKLLEQHARSDVISPTFKFPSYSSPESNDFQLLDLKSCNGVLIKQKLSYAETIKRTNLLLKGRPSIHGQVQKSSGAEESNKSEKRDEGIKSGEAVLNSEEKVSKSPNETKPQNDDDELQITAIFTAPKGKNSLEDKLKDSKYYRNDWLQNFKAENEAKHKAMEQEIQAAKARSRMLEERHRKNEKSLEEKVAKELSLLDLTFPQDIKELPPEDILVPLTDEMENIIDCAFSGGPANQVLADKFNIQVTRRDIATLSGLNWLNDEVVNFYMNLLMERGKNEKFLNVYAFNTFFYPKLMKNGFSSIKRWTKKVNVFAQDLLLVPVHLGMHWCLATVDIRSKTIRYYDSMLGDNNSCLQGLLAYLCEEHQDKQKSPFDTAGWSCEIVKDIPQQMNGSDCGMFACKFAEYLSRDADISFTQENMPYFRRRMVYEIVTQKLL